ncbi:MAG: hypothetical protein AAF518_06755 [Spirochaetota bacterium]
MELLALVLVNIVLGVILYFIISIRVTSSLREYQVVRWKKEIQNHTINFYKESENYLALMDSKIVILKNLIQKAESLGIQFDTPEENQKSLLKQKEEKIKSMLEEKQVDVVNKELEPVAKEVRYNPKETAASLSSGILSNVFSGAGKAFMSIMGVPDSPSDSTKVSLQANPPVSVKTNQLDLSIGGDPLQEKGSKVEDNLNESEEEQQFKNVFNSLQFGYRDFSENQPEDTSRISLQSALSEIDEESTKVDKIVYLLQKGYSSTEISEEMDISLSEVRLIETIKLEKAPKR